MNKINTFINIISDYAFPKEEEDSMDAFNLRYCLSLVFNTEFQIKDNSYAFRLRRAQQVALKVIDDTQDGIFSSVKSYLFHCMALPIYRTINLSNRQFKILLKGYVQNDGVGDYFYMIRVAQVLQRALPGASITIAAEVQDLNARRKQLPVSEFSTFFWGVISRGNSDIKYEEKGYQERFRCSKLAREAHVVFDLPHSSFENSCFSTSHSDFKHKSQRIIEVGGAGKSLDAIPPPHQLMSMGVREFEYGLMLTKLTLTSSLNDLSNQSLKEFFFDPEFLVKDGGEKEYHASHRLHFAYLHHRIQDFIQLCLRVNQKDDNSIIDIVANEDSLLNEKIFENYNIERLVVYSSSSDGMVKKAKILSASGKIVRLFTAFPIPNQDLQIVASLSYSCIGCTGDNSLLDILSRGQLPFYEVVDHKKMFWLSLCQLASEFFGSVDSPFVRYLKQLNKGQFIRPADDLDRLAELLEDRRIYDECRQFCCFLRQHYNFNETLIDVVHKKLACSLNPGIRKLQEELLEAYTNDEMTLPECQNKLQAFISNNRI